MYRLLLHFNIRKTKFLLPREGLLLNIRIHILDVNVYAEDTDTDLFYILDLHKNFRQMSENFNVFYFFISKKDENFTTDVYEGKILKFLNHIKLRKQLVK